MRYTAAAFRCDERRHSETAGSKSGEHLKPFKVVQVTSPELVKTESIVGTKKNAGPHTIVFLHKLTVQS